MSQVCGEILIHAFMISCLDYSNSLPSGIPLERGERARTSVRPLRWEAFGEAGVRAPPLGGFASGCQRGPGLTARGPSDVFLKHCVNPNALQVPWCPSPILCNCKHVGFSFVQNCYYKSPCPIAFPGVIEYVFPGQIQRISPVTEFRSRLQWTFNLLSVNSGGLSVYSVRLGQDF